MSAITLLGVGNILWADEGFGVRAVEALNAAFVFPDCVTLVDGGTQGLALLPIVEDADVLVILDAVDYALAPGSLFMADDDEVPRCLTAKKMSLHQTSMLDILGLARLSERLPAHMRLIGVQPLDIETYGGTLSGLVRARIAPAVTETLAYLARFGISAAPREAADDAACLGPASVTLSPYEAGRPL